MEKSSIEKNIKEILIRIGKGDRITETGAILDGMDSITLLTIICLIEKEYHIEIPPQNIFSIRSMNDAVKIINDAYNNKIQSHEEYYKNNGHDIRNEKVDSI